jgi:DNA polymerase III subunit delta'
VRLEQLAGQSQAATILRRALAAGRIAHAYLFEGPAGVGKRSAAVGLAMALNCDARAEAEARGDSACGACDACRRIEAGLHPDVPTFAPDGTQIVIGQAQEIVALGQRRPHEARARVIIVDDADRLNANASNCLLKTLEEPLPGNHLILVTPAPDRLLGTILSRTQRVRFRAVSVETLRELGARRGIEPDHARVAAILANGSVARFVELVTNTEDDGARDAAAVLRVAARGRGISSILDAAAGLGDKDTKATLPGALALLARLYRDAVVISAGAPELAALGDADASGAPDKREGDPSAPPVELSLSALGRSLEAILDAEAALAANVNAVMAVEALLLRLRREERASS